MDGVVFEDKDENNKRGGMDGPVTVRDHLTSDATLAYVSTPMRLPQVQHPTVSVTLVPRSSFSPSTSTPRR